MLKFEKIDWVTFSWDGTFGDVAHIEDLFRKIGVNLIKRGGNMFYRFALVGEGVFLAYQNRMRNNRFFQVELSGKFFFSRGREEWACEFIRMFKGYPSRIDVAWDFFPEDLLDVQDVELLQKIDSKYPMKHHRHIVNGVDTGFSLGMGKGSEVSLRMYDKLTEQKALGKTEVEVNGCNEWWRVEIQVCGNTLKDQGGEMD